MALTPIRRCLLHTQYRARGGIILLLTQVFHQPRNPMESATSKVVKAPSIHIERERRCVVLMEWTSDAQFHTLLRVSLRTSLHEAVVCEHLCDAYLTFYLVKVHPLCHTFCPFLYMLK